MPRDEIGYEVVNALKLILGIRSTRDNILKGLETRHVRHTLILNDLVQPVS